MSDRYGWETRQPGCLAFSLVWFLVLVLNVIMWGCIIAAAVWFLRFLGVVPT